MEAFIEALITGISVGCAGLLAMFLYGEAIYQIETWWQRRKSKE